MNRTYSRQPANTSVLPKRKPLGTFNSAPVLSKVTTMKKNKKVEDASNSLDDFVVTTKPAVKKTTSLKKETKIMPIQSSPSLFSDESTNSNGDTNGSPPTPVFRGVEKDDMFDKLFAGPVKTNNAPKSGNSWEQSSSKEYHSAESTLEKDMDSSNGGTGLLFASFGKQNSIDERKAAAKCRKPRKGNFTKQNRNIDRLFSEDTLEFAVDAISALKIADIAAEKSNEDNNDSIDVFASPEPDHSAASKTRTPVIIQFSKSYLSPATESSLSPAIGLQATSTPTLGVKPMMNVSDHEFPKSPVAANEGARLVVPELVARKGGKNWRRSERRTTMGACPKKVSSGFVLSRLAMDNARRRQTTAYNVIDEDAEDLDQDGFQDANLEISILNHSSFHIEPIDGAGQAITSTTLLTMSTLSDVDKILSRCNEQRIVPFVEMYTDDRLSKAFKVGEGAFGEVFMLPNHIDKDPPVVKIVPVEGSALVNGHPQTKLADMLGEIIISTELSKLAQNCLDTVAHGFVPVHRCNLTAGVYPDMLLEKWDVFHKEKTSENDRPDQDLFKDQVEPQKFVVLELGNGGKDLENIVLYNAAQGLAIFEQVAHAIAMAEQEFMFEHRDLHWGNILVRECEEKHIIFQHGSHRFKVETMGVRATIIDFSLSRMTLPNDGCNIFNNLTEDEELFKSEGDYQFDIYRMMKEHTKDEWRGFFPKTNVFWLHYLLDKLSTDVYYKNKKSKVHRSAATKIRLLKDSYLDLYKSAFDYVTSDKENVNK